jgi:phosphoribosyl-ATP pyrophosphohydrolase
MTLENLYKTIASRKNADAETSYTSSLFNKGTKKIAEKLGEEAFELVIAAVAEDKESVIYESADLLYHLLVLLADKEIDIQDVISELERRQGTSGIKEKNSRNR